MRILKFLLIILALTLGSIFFYIVRATIANAGSLNPTFGVTLADKSPGVASNMEFTVTNPVGSSFISSLKIGIPAGWIVASGSNFPDGTVMGTGSFTATFITLTTYHFQILNSTDLQGHLVHFRIEFTDTPIPVTLDHFIDGSEKDGYVLILNSGSVGFLWSLPTETIFTLNGAPDGIVFISTSKFQGDYAWKADFTSIFSETVSKPENVNIPSSKTPIGTNVDIMLANGAEIVFANVSGDGLTSIVSQATPSPEGTGQFQISPPDGLYYNLSSTAIFDCPCTITLPYDPKTTPKPAISHLNTGIKPATWEDVTLKVDDVANTVTGETNSF